MTGSALFALVITIIVIFAVVAMLYLALPKISPDETFTQIGKIGIGVIALILLLRACWAVLFGGGGATGISETGLIHFAVGLIGVLIVIFLIYMAVDYLIPQFSTPVKYVVGGVALIAILLLAETVLLGGGFPGLKRAGLDVPSVQAPRTQVVR